MTIERLKTAILKNWDEKMEVCETLIESIPN